MVWFVKINKSLTNHSWVLKSQRSARTLNPERNILELLLLTLSRKIQKKKKKNYMVKQIKSLIEIALLN